MIIWQFILPFALMFIFLFGTVLVMLAEGVRRIYPDAFKSVDNFKRSYLGHWRGDRGGMILDGLVLGFGSFTVLTFFIHALIHIPLFVISTLLALLSAYGIIRWLKASDDVDE